MNETGFIYVLINPSMEGLVKVGKTTKDPKGRADELSKATGVPTPFIVAYYLAVNDCNKAEDFVHTYLETRGYRVASNREFFNAPLNVTIDAILEYNINTSANIQNEMIVSNNGDFIDSLTIANKTPWASTIQLADEYYLGYGDTIQDYFEAIKLYKQAAKLGSTEAYLKLGKMHMHGYGCLEDGQKSLEYFKEGAKQGDISCYAEMENLFLFKLGHVDNAVKCWDKYINNIDSSDSNAGMYCYNYIDLRLNNDIEILNPQSMSRFKDKIIEWGTQSLQYAEDIDSEQIIVQQCKNVLTYVKNVL